MRKLLSFFVLIIGNFAISNAQTIVFDSDNPGDFSFSDNRKIEKQSVCNVIRQDGKPVYDIEVFVADRSQYAVNLSFRSSLPFAKGDVMLATVTMRTIYARQETGESAVDFQLQTPAPTYEKSFRTPIGCDKEWTTFSIPFRSHNDFGKGGAQIDLALGALAQHIQVKDLRIVNYGPDKDISELPATRFSYPGREDGAIWRTEAFARIDSLRTSFATVRVLDSRGKAVKGADVHIAMDRSDFNWGCSIGAPYFCPNGEVDSVYAANLKRCFNTAVVGNGLKAGGWAEAGRRAATVETFRWLEDNGFRIRGHNLVWPGWKFNPKATRMMAMQDREMFDRFIKAQFYERMAFAKGRLIAWDVVNEPMHEKDFFSVLPQGEDTMVEWFRLAKSLDPSAKLFINDYSMLNCVQSAENIKAYIKMISGLLEKGAPVEAIGVQGHCGTQPRAPQLVLSDLDLFIPLGLPVEITEWDINTKDEQLQADYSRDFLIAVYSHPVIEGVTMWGFWEADHWKRDAALYRRDWSPKPNAAVWDELVLGRWKTDVTAKTDRKGTASARAHHGEYTVTVNYRGRTVEKKCHIGGKDCDIEIIL